MNRARDVIFDKGWFSSGIRFYPYQVGLGVSISLWPLDARPEISLHIGPFKFWLGVSGTSVLACIKCWGETDGLDS